jgi:hypothetical protein
MVASMFRTVFCPTDAAAVTATGDEVRDRIAASVSAAIRH